MSTEVPAPILADLHRVIPATRHHQVLADADLSDIGLDEIDKVTLACALEERLSVEMPDAEYQGWQTVGDVIAAAERYGRTAG